MPQMIFDAIDYVGLVRLAALAVILAVVVYLHFVTRSRPHASELMAAPAPRAQAAARLPERVGGLARK